MGEQIGTAPNVRPPTLPGGPGPGPRPFPVNNNGPRFIDPTSGLPVASPWPPYLPLLPPGYPQPGINPAPYTPEYDPYVKKCWDRYKNDCFNKNPGAAVCGNDTELDDFIDENKRNGTWPSENQYTFVDCQTVSEFNSGRPFDPTKPINSWPDSPCGTAPGKTVHCKVWVQTPAGGQWVSERDAVSYFACTCCDPKNPQAPAGENRKRAHFPGGNRVPVHSIDPPIRR